MVSNEVLYTAGIRHIGPQTVSRHCPFQSNRIKNHKTLVADIFVMITHYRPLPGNLVNWQTSHVVYRTCCFSCVAGLSHTPAWEAPPIYQVARTTSQEIWRNYRYNAKLRATVYCPITKPAIGASTGPI